MRKHLRFSKEISYYINLFRNIPDWNFDCCNNFIYNSTFLRYALLLLDRKEYIEKLNKSLINTITNTQSQNTARTVLYLIA